MCLIITLMRNALMRNALMRNALMRNALMRNARNAKVKYFPQNLSFPQKVSSINQAISLDNPVNKTLPYTLFRYPQPQKNV